MMNLTPEQLSILAHVVISPQEWADHAAATVGEAAVFAKIDKYRNEYLQAVTQPNYKNRAQRAAFEGLINAGG